MPSVPTFSDIKDNFIYLVDIVSKLIVNHNCPTKVEIKDVIVHSITNLSNVLSPDGIRGDFGFSIIVAT